MTIKKCTVLVSLSIYQQKILKQHDTTFNFPWLLKTTGGKWPIFIYSVELKRRAALLECTETHASELIISNSWEFVDPILFPILGGLDPIISI